MLIAGIRFCLTLLNLAVLNHRVLSSQADIQGKCDTDLLRQFRIECITENREVSRDQIVPHGTRCLISCSNDTSVSPRGLRICRNGNWEGSVINCKEKAPTVRFESNRNKRGVRRCTRTCRRGWWWSRRCHTHCFYLPEIQCPTVPLIQYAARSKTYVNVYWNYPTASGGVGHRSISQTRGLSSGSRFYGTQYHIIEYKVVDEQGNRAYCSFYFQVIVRKCNYPTRPYNGAYTCSKYPVIYGATCSFTCNIGYKLVGQTTLTCGAYRSFNFPPPRCETVKCTTPPLRITDGVITCPSNPIYQSLCSIQCNNGFAQSPRGSFSCNQYGRWVGTFRCTDVTPPVFDKCPQNMIVETDRNRTDAQVSWIVSATDNTNGVSLVKTEGPDNSSRLTVGTYTISYTATDQSGHSVTCSFTVTVKGLACKPPQFVEDDRDLVSTCVSLVVGASCSLSCKHNKKLEGDSIITCEKDDNMQTYWKYLNLPNCVGEKCPNLTAPRNGALSCSKWNDGAFCSVQCSSRYQIAQGVPELHICGSDGKWTPPENSERRPNCVRRKPGTGKSVTTELALYYDGSCEDAKDQIKQNFINKLNGRYQGLCKPEEGCTVQNVDVICGATERRKRSSKFLHQISKRSAAVIYLVWDVVVKFSANKTYEEGVPEVENVITRVLAVIEIDIKNGTYDDLAPGVRTDRESLYTFPSELVCDLGLKPNYQTNTCASCPTGTIYDKIEDDCQPCPLGTYQDEEGSFICKRCPYGTTTQDVASTHQDNCTQICAAGYFSQTGIRPCSPCPLGTFQNQTHSTTCLRCPNGKTSLQEASTDIDSCKEFDFEFEDVGYIRSGLTPRTNSSYDESYLSEFTFVALLQIKEQGMDMSIQQNGVSYFSIHIGQQITVTISGVSKSVPSILGAWFHIVVTVSSTSTGVKLFSLGQLEKTTQFSSGTSIPRNGTFLHLQSRHGDRVTMRYLRVVSGLLTVGQIASLTNTCGLTDDDILFSLDVFDNLLIRNVSAVSPSTCDVTNDCLSSPCGNHTCTDKVDGFNCTCKDGYTGTTCNIPPDYCVNHLCENGATCINSPATKNYTCVCPNGFRATLCDYEIVNGGWSDWGNWSQCSVTCNNGVRSRERTCTNPPPDVDGRPCTGNASETEACTQPECPECRKSDLTLPDSVDKVTCNGTINALTCTPTCKVGMIYTTDEPIFYQCSDGEWSPGTHVAPCSKKTVPTYIEVVIWLKLRGILDCHSINDSAVLQQVQSTVSILPCSANRNCLSLAIFSACGDGVKVTFNISTTRSIAGLAAAMKTVDDTANILQKNVSLFDVNLNGAVYSGDINAIETLNCPLGSVVTDQACVECPPGTYYSTVNGTECILCDRGTFQPYMGMTSCLNCQPGFTTEYIGSLDASKCSVTAGVV
ncbi:hypothetical protein SNE40_000907 [Patella caerulea]|uniref:Sushi, von Willebrand factor type A, EGF and pentraxin domain-containing protein 1-like n=1 Tax=Patella caerulea TaxID=87958 RepID=A0AAN8KHI4_PATCE